jgi:hypothetical protein
VYVRHFPNTGVKKQISTRGGAQGRWRHDGQELYYLTLDGKLMAVDIKASSSSIEPGTPQLLFNTGITGSPVARMITIWSRATSAFSSTAAPRTRIPHPLRWC